MYRNRKWKVTMWSVLGVYMAVALLPAGAIVYCVSESGHLAIELAHTDCPQVTYADASVRQGMAFFEQSLGCTDIKLALSADYFRKESNPFLTLPSRTFLAIPPILPTYQIHHYPACKLSDFAPRHQPTDFLRTVVLLI